MRIPLLAERGSHRNGAVLMNGLQTRFRFNRRGTQQGRNALPTHFGITG